MKNKEKQMTDENNVYTDCMRFIDTILYSGLGSYDGWSIVYNIESFLEDIAKSTDDLHELIRVFNKAKEDKIEKERKDNE